MKNFRQKNRKGKNADFWDTVQDIKTMTQPHLQQNKGHFKEAPGKKKQKGLKMPLPILKGVRKNIINTIKADKQHNIEHNVQYRSDIKTKDANFLDKLKKRKSEFEKNKYKFKEMRTKSSNVKKGVLQLSKHDLKK